LRGVCAVTIEILAFGLTLEHIACEGIIKKLRDPEHGSKRTRVARDVTAKDFSNSKPGRFEALLLGEGGS
jgi:hypothetical protein